MTKLDNLKQGIVKGYNKVSFQAVKHSPEILAGIGVVGVVASTVMACKATMKINDVLEDAKDQLDKVKEVANDPKFADQYNEEDAKKDTTIIMTSHNLRELEDICEHVGLLHKGGILFDREVDAMKTEIHKVQMVLPGEEPDLGSFRAPNGTVMHVVSYKKSGSVFRRACRRDKEIFFKQMCGFVVTVHFYA